MQLFCSGGGILFEPSIIMVHLNLAQWHALIALNQTGGCTTPDAVVAFASYKVVQNYFPFNSDNDIDPLLSSQLKAMKLSKSEKKLAKRLGEAVAKRLLESRLPYREFVADDLKEAILERQGTLGLFGYVNNTPHNENVSFVTHYLALQQPFLLPDLVDFIEEYLGGLKPPKVPSDEWDQSYASLVDVGRVDWPGRTAAMNFTAGLYSCPKLNVTYTKAGCDTPLTLLAVAIDSLPASTPLYDAVTLFAQLSVSQFETEILIAAMKDCFFFWRPAMAFRSGDPRHRPFPNWTPFQYTFFDPEYPSGTVAQYANGATVIQSFFGKKKVSFTLDGNGAFGPTCPGVAGVVIPPRHFDSLRALVEEAKLGRIYSGAHYNNSVRDGEIVGETIAKFVLKHWAKTTPTGVLPDTEYLNIFAELPPKAGDFSPTRYEV